MLCKYCNGFWVQMLGPLSPLIPQPPYIQSFYWIWNCMLYWDFSLLKRNKLWEKISTYRPTRRKKIKPKIIHSTVLNFESLNRALHILFEGKKSERIEGQTKNVHLSNANGQGLNSWTSLQSGIMWLFEFAWIISTVLLCKCKIWTEPAGWIIF